MRLGQIIKEYGGSNAPREDNSLVIPAQEYLVKSVQILAKKRTGKTYTASKIAEELLKEGLPIAIVDPMSAYYGLKEKFKIVVFGDVNDPAKHADYPLVADNDKIEDQAELIADFIATNPTAIIIDISGDGWVDSRQQKFMAAFAKRYYQANKIARHVFIEEADIFIPQTVQYQAEIDSRHYVDHMVRRGGQKGIGTTIISQRASVVSKNVTSQSDLSIFLHLKDKADLDPARHEINNDEDLSKDEQAEIIKTIKSMPPGEAFFYSSSWLKVKAFVKVDKKETYHAGATRGTVDFREPSEVTFVPVDIEDVVSKLHDIATQTSTKDQKPSKPSTVPDLQDKVKLDRLLDEAKEQGRKEVSEKYENYVIPGLKKDHETELEKVKAQYKDIEELLSSLRKVLGTPSVILNSTSVGVSAPTETTVTTSDIALSVLVETKKLELTDKTPLGRLAILIADGFFNEIKFAGDIYREIARRFNVPSLLKGGGKNTKPYRDALDELASINYGYLKQDGAGYLSTGKKISKTEVVVN